jgi:hypothetical protein
MSPSVPVKPSRISYDRADVSEWDGPAVLPPLTAQRMCEGLEARGAHRYVP